MEKLRKLVSGDKYRYVDPALGVNLDLTYITPRLIAMGLPGQSVDTLWRNDIDDVAKFLRTRHGTKYMVVNLSGEKYDYKKFYPSEIRDFYFPDHSPPDIPLLLDIMKAMEQYLIQDPDNVVAVHCLAGRSRTGCVIACFLLHCGMMNSAEDAIRHFNDSRSTAGRNIVLPSQIRYVQYYETILRTGIDAATPKPRQLVRVELSPLPPVQKCKHVGSITPVIQFYSHRAPRSLLYHNIYTRKFRYRDDPKAAVIDLDAVIEGDIQVRLFHQARSANKFARIVTSDVCQTKVALTSAPKFPLVPLCRATFNTAFVDDNSLRVTFSKLQLDAVYAGPLTSPVFPENFQLTLVFDAPQQRNPMSVLHDNRAAAAASPTPLPMVQLPSAPSTAPRIEASFPTAPTSMPVPAPMYHANSSPHIAHLPLHVSAPHISPRYMSSPPPVLPASASAPTPPPWVTAHTSDNSLVHPSQLVLTPAHPHSGPEPWTKLGSSYLSPHSSMGAASQWSSMPPVGSLPPVVLPPHTDSTPASLYASQPSDPLQMSVLPNQPNGPGF